MQFLACVAPKNSSITLSKVYTRRASAEAVLLQPCFLDVLFRHIPDIQNLANYMDSMFRCYFLLNMNLLS